MTVVRGAVVTMNPDREIISGGDELSATLTLAESLSNGITTTFEAGTVAHPARVVAAAQTVGARVTVGTWDGT